ncbi:MAG: hypothetical protein M5U28_12405 [Sandaracinaceae bacterium]|nr:hypothetical protein [Sandaracinaceae bacterium]
MPVAGAPEGRYALDGEACGLSSDDAAAIAEAVGPPGSGVRRYLLSFAAPRTAGSPSSGIASVEAGSPLVSQLLERTARRGRALRVALRRRGTRARRAAAPLGAAARRGLGPARRRVPRPAGRDAPHGGPEGLEEGADSP